MHRMNKILNTLMIVLSLSMTVPSSNTIPVTNRLVDAATKIVSTIQVDDIVIPDKNPTVEDYKIGYTTSSVNVREKPSTKSDILETLEFNTKVKYRECNKEWVEISYKNKSAYLYKEYVSVNEPTYIEYLVPKNSGFKSYMSYKAITAKSSLQYQLQYEQAYTGEYGIRQVNGRFCVAIGSYFTSDIGTLFDLILENGTVIPCILADQKADCDTDAKNIITMHNGCMSEFVVDMLALDKTAKKHGDISYCNDKWNSPVKTIRVY